jgi:hypothetical protein
VNFDSGLDLMRVLERAVKFDLVVVVYVVVSRSLCSSR